VSIRRPILASMLAVSVTACAGRPLAPTPEAELALAHRDDARAAAQPTDGTWSSLAEFEKKVLEIRDAWDERLKAPESVLTFVDFSTPEMLKLRAAARADAFAASLAEGLSVGALLAGAFERNPGLDAARRNLAGTIEEYSQVTYLDTILRQYASFARSAQTGIGPALPMDTVAKRFPFPGTLELKAAVVRHAVEMAHAAYEAALRDVVTDLRVACADHAFLAAAIATTRETIGYLRQLEETARGKVATASAQKAHVIQTQVQIAQQENDLLTLERERDTVRTRIVTLLDLPAGTPLGELRRPPMRAFPKDLDALRTRALATQPDILAAAARAARMATMIELAEQASFPDLSPGLWTMEDVSHATGGSAKEREPFGTRPKGKPDPWFGSKEAYLREARSAEQAARRRLADVRNRTLLRLQKARNDLETARRLYELYAQVQIGQAEQAWHDASAGYASDRMEFMNVIDALRQLLRFRLERDRAERDYQRAFAELEAAVGAPVD